MPWMQRRPIGVYRIRRISPEPASTSISRKRWPEVSARPILYSRGRKPYWCSVSKINYRELA